MLRPHRTVQPSTRGRLHSGQNQVVDRRAVCRCADTDRPDAIGRPAIPELEPGPTDRQRAIAPARAAGLGIAHTGSPGAAFFAMARSEEHTSELQSLMRISYAVFCLKKKNTHKQNILR